MFKISVKAKANIAVCFSSKGLSIYKIDENQTCVFFQMMLGIIETIGTALYGKMFYKFQSTE